ncbi:MAG: AI-2E family transporter [Eubacteriales bacterium]|nr:AI-2E family transporter [Eubacteriales bacterium]
MDPEIKYSEDKRTITSIVKYALIIAIVGLVFFYGFKVLWLILPVLLGFVIAYTASLLSTTLYRLFMRRRPALTKEDKDTRGFKALKLIIYFVILLLFIGFIVLVILTLIAQVRNLISFVENNLNSFDIIKQVSDYLNDLSEKLGGILPESAIARLTIELDKIQDDILDMIPDITSRILSTMLASVTNFPDMIFKVIVVIMAGYYFIADRIVIDSFIKKLFPSENFVSKVVGTIRTVASSLFRVLGGYIIIMTVTFIEALIGLTIIRMPYAVILAIIVMFVDLLPMVGASACFVPISIYMFIQGQPIYGLIALSFVGIMTFVRSIMEPKIIGTAIRMHPLATLVSMLLGVAAFGFIGFLGGPVLVIFIVGLANAFGFKDTFRNWTGKILNKVADRSSVASQDPGNTDTRIRHVVMWKLKEEHEGSSKAEIAEEIGSLLSELPEEIPQIIALKTGTDAGIDHKAYDFILIVDFSDKGSFEEYIVHPAHQAAASRIKELTTARSAVDLVY